MSAFNPSNRRLTLILLGALVGALIFGLSLGATCAVLSGGR